MAFNPNSVVTVSVTVTNQGNADTSPMMTRSVLNSIFKASQVLYDGFISLPSAQTFTFANAGVVFARYTGNASFVTVQVFDGQLAGAASFQCYPGGIVLYYSPTIINTNQDGINKVVLTPVSPPLTGFELFVAQP
jgi:hypothetical protein